MTGAAEELIVTQPSISAAVAALSREVGVPLTERVGRTIRTSAAGEVFTAYAADVIGLLDQGRLAAQEIAAATERQVRIAAVTTAAEYVVPPIMQAFSAIHPEIELTLEVGNRGRMFERVADHFADVAIGGRPPAHGRLAGAAFMENEIVLVGPPDDPLAGSRTARVEDLADRVWLLREEGSGTRLMTEQFLQGHELSPRVLTLGSNGGDQAGLPGRPRRVAAGPGFGGARARCRPAGRDSAPGRAAAPPVVRAAFVRRPDARRGRGVRRLRPYPRCRRRLLISVAGVELRPERPAPR